MVVYRRERPVCRKRLVLLMNRYDCTLEELLKKPAIYFTPNIKTQAKKMLDEGEFHTAKELREDERRNNLYRDVGLIK